MQCENNVSNTMVDWLKNSSGDGSDVEVQQPCSADQAEILAFIRSFTDTQD